MKDALVALVRQSILTVLDEANPRTPGLAWDFNDDEQRVDFADRVAAFLPSAPVSETAFIPGQAAATLADNIERDGIKAVFDGMSMTDAKFYEDKIVYALRGRK